MNKRTLCRTATLFFGLLALSIQTYPVQTGPWRNNNLTGMALGLVSAIFATQWLAYQKRREAASAQPGWPAWVRRLLFSSTLFLTVLTTQAQTNWTDHFQGTGGRVVDVAYGAGVYVAVGDDGTTLRSTDGKFWVIQVGGGSANNGLLSIVYAAGQFVAVGYSGRILTSTDGIVWTTRVSGTIKALEGVTYGGGKFVAVGREGTVLTSTTGKIWTNQTAGTTLNFYDIAYSTGHFVAVGAAGLIKTSPDGSSWTTRTGQTTTDLRGVIAGYSGSFVAVGLNSTIVTTLDGVSWSSQVVNGADTHFTAVAYSAQQGQYVAVAQTGTLLYTSTDRITWTAHPTGTKGYLSGIEYLNDQFIAVGEDGLIRSSYNGTYWKSRTLEYHTSFYGSAYGNGRYVAIGECSAGSSLAANVAATSTDGTHFSLSETMHLDNAGKRFNDVAFGNGLFAAVGEEAMIQTSVDGTNWDFRQAVAGQTLRAVAFGGGHFVALGDKGFISRSSDGKNWSNGFMGSAGNYHGLTYANGQFMAVGQYGAVATSPNGVIWTVQPALTNKQFKSVAYGNGRWVAVGYDGLVACRIDGLPWVVYQLSGGSYLNDILFSNGQFVAVGLNKRILTSTTGLTWTARKANTDLTQNLNTLTYGSGLFVTLGDDSWAFTSPDNNPAAASAQPTYPATDAQARLATPEPEVRLQAMSYPNPVIDDFMVDIAGASSQAVRLWVVDITGRTVSDKQINPGEGLHRESMSLGQHEPGMYLLRVSTADQTQTLKILKQ